MRSLAVALAALALAPVAAAASGKQLYFANCVWCHGDRLQGIPLTRQQEGPGGDLQAGPRLRGTGEVAADFYLSTGYMPLRNALDQPKRKHPRFDPPELRALVRFIGSYGGPKIPPVHPERGSLETGMTIFTERCAGCHQITGEGGIVTGAEVPSLKQATAKQIAEAVRVGPYVMPRYSEHEISQRELDSVVRYVLYAKDPNDKGGWALEHLGPIPEGMVAWLLAGTALLVVARLLGEALKK